MRTKFMSYANFTGNEVGEIILDERSKEQNSVNYASHCVGKQRYVDSSPSSDVLGGVVLTTYEQGTKTNPKFVFNDNLIEKDSDNMLQHKKVGQVLPGARKITFVGTIGDINYGQIDLIRLDDGYLYGTKIDFDGYQKIGPAIKYIPNDAVTLFPDNNFNKSYSHVMLTKNGQYHTVDASISPAISHQWGGLNIQFKSDRKINFIDLNVPSYVDVSWDGAAGEIHTLRRRFYDKYGVCIEDTHSDRGYRRLESPANALNSLGQNTLGNAKYHLYRMSTSARVNSKRVIEAVDFTFDDGKLLLSSFTYDDIYRIKSVTSQTVEFSNDKFNTILQETLLDYVQYYSLVASERIQKRDVQGNTHVVKYEKHNYQTNKILVNNITGFFTMLYLSQTKYADTLNINPVFSDNDFKNKKSVKLTNDYLMPLVWEGISTSNSLNGMIIRHVYSGSRFCKSVATFYNCISDEHLFGSAFLSFEEYEAFNYSSQESTIVNELIGFTKVRLSNNAFLGQRSLLCEADTVLSLGKSFKIEETKTYIVSFWCKDIDEARKWTYKEVFVNGADIKTTRKIPKLFDNNTLIDCFAVYEKNTQFTANFYDTNHGILIASLNENHIPTLYFYDELNRNVTTCDLKIHIDDQGDFQCDFRKIRLHPVKYAGYSRFSGYNCALASNKYSNYFNTIMEIVPYDESFVYSSSAKKELALNNKDGIYVCGPIISKNQEIRLNADPYNLSINFDNQIATVHINGEYLCSSEKYIFRRSSWAIILVQNILIIVANGKIVLSTILKDKILTVFSVSADPINTSSNLFNEENSVYITPKFNASMQYYDFKENLLQQQTFKIGLENATSDSVRVITQQNFYDASGGTIIKTLNAPYPVKPGDSWLSTDHPLLYRDKFAVCRYTDPLNVSIEGEVLDYYLNEGAQHFSYIDETKKGSQWPFETFNYETSLSGRLLKYYPAGHHRLILSKDFDYFWADRTFTPLTEFGNEYIIDSHASYNINTPSTTFPGNFAIKTETLGNTKESFVTKTKGTYLGSPEESYQHYSEVVTHSNNNVSIVETSYFGGDSEKVLVGSLQTTIFNRIIMQSGPGFASRFRICDNLGFTKLATSDSSINILKDLKYSEYDIWGRIVEAGNAVYTKGTLTAVAAAALVNELQSGVKSFSDVGFTKTPKYKYSYDYQDTTHGNSIFNIAKLTKVENLANKSQTHYTYDYAGRKVSEIYEDLKGKQKVSFSYDLAGRVLTEQFTGITLQTETDILGDTCKKYLEDTEKMIPVVNTIKYDVDNHLSQYETDSGDPVKKVYDVFGNELSLENGSFKISNNYCSKTKKPFTVNLLQEKTYQDEGLNKKETFDYNIMSFVKSFIDAENHETSYQYNDIGNITSMTEQSDSKTFVYNLDQLVGYKDNKEVLHTIMEYDDLGRSTLSKCNPICQFDFKYSDFFDSRLSKITRTDLSAPETGISNDEHVSYHVDEILYDNLGRIKNLKISGQGETAYKKETKYFYGPYGNILRTITDLNGNTQETLYLYAENVLVGLYDTTNNKLINLLYDQNNVLRALSYKNSENTLYKKNIFYKNVWGEFDASFDDLDPYLKDNVSFFYGSCMYIKELGINLLNGSPYIEQYGLIGTPKLNSNSFSPYRLKGNKPL